MSEGPLPNNQTHISLVLQIVSPEIERSQYRFLLALSTTMRKRLGPCSLGFKVDLIVPFARLPQYKSQPLNLSPVIIPGLKS